MALRRVLSPIQGLLASLRRVPAPRRATMCTARESEMFWGGKIDKETDKRVPRKKSKIPDHSADFVSGDKDMLLDRFSQAESRLHKKVGPKSDRETWDAISRAQKYILEKEERDKKGQ